MGARVPPITAVVPSSTRHVAARKAPDSPTRRLGNRNTDAALRARHERLAKLAEDPGDAHRAWRRLSAAEQEELLGVMQELYGKEVAAQFFEIADAGTAQVETHHWGPGVGPTPHRMRELGYRRKGKLWLGPEIEMEWWVHPSGKSVYRDVSPRKEPAEESGESTPVDDQGEALKMLRQMIVANNQLEKYCETRPLETGKAAGAMIDFDSAHGKLLNQLKDVDMSRHPRFWQKVEAQLTRNDVVRMPCCEEQPGNFWFRCSSIIERDDE
jgi:hypothetical protein